MAFHASSLSTVHTTGRGGGGRLRLACRCDRGARLGNAPSPPPSPSPVNGMVVVTGGEELVGTITIALPSRVTHRVTCPSTMMAEVGAAGMVAVVDVVTGGGGGRSDACWWSGQEARM